MKDVHRKIVTRLWERRTAARDPDDRSDHHSEVDLIHAKGSRKLIPHSGSKNRRVSGTVLPPRSSGDRMKRYETEEPEQKAEEDEEETEDTEMSSTTTEDEETEDMETDEDEIEEFEDKQLNEPENHKKKEKEAHKNGFDVREYVRKRERNSKEKNNMETKEKGDDAGTTKKHSNHADKRSDANADNAQQMQESAMDKTSKERAVLIGRLTKCIVKKKPIPMREIYRLFKAFGANNTTTFEAVADATDFFNDLSEFGEAKDRKLLYEFMIIELRRYCKQLSAEQMTVVLDTVAKKFNV